MSDPIQPHEIRLPERISALILRSDGHYSRIYRDGMKFRRESYTPDKSRRVVISRDDLGVAYRIVESERGYFAIRSLSELARLHKGQQDFIAASDWVWTKKEEIDGETCDVYAIENPPQNGQASDFPVPREIIHISQNTKLLRRLTTFDKQGNVGIAIDWLEVSFEAIPPELFEVPDGFVELSLTSGMPLKKKAKKS